MIEPASECERNRLFTFHGIRYASFQHA